MTFTGSWYLLEPLKESVQGLHVPINCCSFFIDERRLIWSNSFPGGNGLTNQRIDWLGESTPGFVYWNIEQANRFFRLCFCEICCFLASDPCLYRGTGSGLGSRPLR